MFLTKLKNGYYYIYFIDINGKRNKVSTRTKVKSEAREFLISFQSTFSERKKEKLEPLTLKQFRWKFLKHLLSVVLKDLFKFLSTERKFVEKA